MGRGVYRGSWQRFLVIRSDGTRDEYQESKPARDRGGD